MPNQLEHYSCVDCGDHIYVDEDGLCVSCGGETTIEKCGDCSRSYVAIRKERDELREKLLRLHAEQQSELEELRAELSIMTRLRQHGCECSDDDACLFARERNAAERERDELRAALAERDSEVERLKVALNLATENRYAKWELERAEFAATAIQNDWLEEKVARLKAVCLQASASLVGLDFANNPYRETQRLIVKLREAGGE